MAELTDDILLFLKDAKDSPVDSLRLSEVFKTDHQKIVGAIKSLQAAGNLINAQQQDSKHWKLTSEGENIVSNGSYEALVFYAIPPEGIPQQQLMKTVPQANVGFSKAMSAGWIYIEKKNGCTVAFRKVDNIIDEVQNNLIKIQNSRGNEVSQQIKQELKKRKLLQEMTLKSYTIMKGADFTVSHMKQITDLTPEMIASSSWKEKVFKPYNFSALGIAPDCGHRHPLMKVRAEFRQIFLEMGFTEMPSNKYIESSFWNFDALFQPQQHPARDAHDTFFVSDPQFADDFPMDYLEKVKKVHSSGGYGSQGYQYDWKLSEAQKNLLRTHTTAVSARILYEHAKKDPFVPGKYFSIDKVFRNETLDATHLAEFQQIEGVVVDRGLALGDLMGVVHQFFGKLGITKLRFKPAYNPYTEPSMEVFSYHEGLKKWVEIGNSGMFRPEMLLPMNLPPDVSVIGFGLSVERPTMIKYKVDNIRELVGHKVNLNMVNANPICRLDK